MNIAARSYLTAGIAALGAGAIALTPIQPLPDHIAVAPAHAVSNLSVELAAAINPIQPWVDLVTTATANTKVLFENWAAGLYVNGTIPTPPNTTTPLGGNGNLGNRTGGYASGTKFPFLQQVFRNQKAFLAQLPDIGGIIQGELANLGSAVKSPFQPGVNLPGTFPSGQLPLFPNGDYNQNVSGVTVASVLGFNVNPRTLLALLPAVSTVPPALATVLELTTTPISGLLVGAIGPVLGPVLSAVTSTKAILTAIQNRDWATAINEALNIPANMTNTFLNGGPTLDLTKLASSLLPPEVTKLGIKMGGLLSPGGVAFDAVAADAGIPNVATISVPGLPVGPIGAFQALTNHVTTAIKPPQQAGASVKRVKAAASTEAAAAAVAGTDQAPAPKRSQLARANRTAHSAAARAERTPRGAAARHAG